jgi:hypothetical protein
MKIVFVPSGLPCAPSPSGIPTILYCLAALLVSGTVSPAEINAVVS